MAKVTATARKALPDSAFADPTDRKFLIQDATHARLAWQMLDRHAWPSAERRAQAKARIMAALKRFGVDSQGFQVNSLAADQVFSMTIDELSALHGILEHDFGVVCDAPMPVTHETSKYSTSISEAVAKATKGNDAPGALFATPAADILLSDGMVEGMMADCLPEEPLAKIPVAKLGVWFHPGYGVISFTQQDFVDMMRNFENDELGFPPFIRYGHAAADPTLPSGDERKPGTVDSEKARGNIIALAQEGPVLFGYAIPSDEEVADDITQKRMRYSSAEVWRNAVSKRDGRPLGPALKAVALTNTPFVPNLPESVMLSNGVSYSTPGVQSFTMGIADDEPDVFEPHTQQPLTQQKENPLMSIFGKAKELTSQLVQLFSQAEAEEVGQKPAGESAQLGAEGASEGLTPDANLGQDGSEAASIKSEAGSSPAPAASQDVSDDKQGNEQSPSEGGEQAKSEDPPVDAVTKKEEGAAPEETTMSTVDNAKYEQLSNDFAELKGQMSEVLGALKASTENNQKLDQLLSNTQAELAATKATAQQFSDQMSQQRLYNMKSQMVLEGIPRSLVEQVFSLTAFLPNEVKLSADAPAQDPYTTAINVLRSLPAECRVPFGQDGHQNLSVDATTSLDAQYGDLLPPAPKS